MAGSQLVGFNSSILSLPYVVIQPGAMRLEMFPFITPFDDLYLMRFPLVDAATGTAFLQPSGAPLELRVSSALGACAVSWSLTE